MTKLSISEEDWLATWSLSVGDDVLLEIEILLLRKQKEIDSLNKKLSTIADLSRYGFRSETDNWGSTGDMVFDLYGGGGYIKIAEVENIIKET